MSNDKHYCVWKEHVTEVGMSGVSLRVKGSNWCSVRASNCCMCTYIYIGPYKLTNISIKYLPKNLKRVGKLTRPDDPSSVRLTAVSP